MLQFSICFPCTRHSPQQTVISHLCRHIQINIMAVYPSVSSSSSVSHLNLKNRNAHIIHLHASLAIKNTRELIHPLVGRRTIHGYLSARLRPLAQLTAGCRRLYRPKPIHLLTPFYSLFYLRIDSLAVKAGN